MTARAAARSLRRYGRALRSRLALPPNYTTTGDVTIDTFLGLTTYSLQNHLRTTVAGIGQIEIDELYIGLDKHGCHFVIPVQAKGGKDQIGIVQTSQDIQFVEQKFPGMRCRAIAAQFMEGDVVALFELALQDNEVRVVEERHYRLVPATALDDAAIRDYRT